MRIFTKKQWNKEKNIASIMLIIYFLWGFLAGYLFKYGREEKQTEEFMNRYNFDCKLTEKQGAKQ